MAYNVPGDPDYEPNPILRAARGSSVSTDYRKTEWGTEGTYKAAGVGGDAPTDQPTIVPGSQTEAKKRMLESPTAVWESTQSYQEKAGTIENIIIGTPTPLQPRREIYVEQRTPQQQYATEAMAIEQARTAPPPTQFKIIGQWTEQAKAQGMPTFDKRQLYSVGYGRTEIYHEYDPNKQFKALGFIPQGRPEPGKAYRQDILGFTSEVGKMSPPSDSMGRVSVGSAKLSQASEMLVFSPFITKVPQPSSGRSIVSKMFGNKRIFSETKPNTERRSIISKTFGVMKPQIAPTETRSVVSKMFGNKKLFEVPRIVSAPSDTRPIASKMFGDKKIFAEAPLQPVPKNTITKMFGTSDYTPKPPTTWNKNLQPIKSHPSRFGEAQYRAIKLKTPGIEMGERTYVAYNWNQAMKLPVVTDIAPVPRSTKMSFTIGAAKKATSPSPPKIIDILPPPRSGSAGNIEMRTSTGQVLIQKQRTIQKQKVEVIQAPKIATQQAVRQKPFVIPMLRQDAKIKQIIRQMPMQRVLAIPKQAPIQTSRQILRQNVFQIPKQTPKMSPFQIPKQAPIQLPKQAPMQLPKQLPKQVAKQRAYQIPKSSTLIPQLKIPKIKLPSGMKAFSMKAGKKFKLSTKSWLKKNRLIGIGDL